MEEAAPDSLNGVLMHNVNTSDNAIIIEPSPHKLNAAIRMAMAEAREAIRQHYLAKFDNIFPVTQRLSTGKKADNYLNGAQIVYHYLTPPEDITILGGYISLVDRITETGKKDTIEVEDILQLIFCDRVKAGAWKRVEHYALVLRHACRIMMCSLLRQDAVLLSPNLKKYVPLAKTDFGFIGFDLLPERVQEILAVYYLEPEERKDWDVRREVSQELELGVDWSQITYSANGASIKDNGIAAVPSRSVKGAMVRLSMCTSFKTINDIDETDIPVMEEVVNKYTIGLYMTYLYLKASDAERDKCIREMWPWIVKMPWLRIYVEKFDKYARREKGRRSRSKKKQTEGSQGGSSDKLAVDTRSFPERLREQVEAASIDGTLNAVALARSLGTMKDRTSLNPVTWPSNPLLAADADKVKEAVHWAEAFRQYARLQKYADKGSLNSFVPFVHYLLVYLPTYFKLNPDSDTHYPSRIEGLNGYHFISRPVEDKRNLPLPYCEFVREYYRECDEYRVYDAIRNLHQFFGILARRREMFGLPAGFDNPVLPSDIPGTGGRHVKSVKKRIPSKVYWLMLLYAYTLYDYVSRINEKCLEDSVFSEHLVDFYHCRDEDHQYMLDVRELDIDLERTIKFNDVEYEVNLVPSTFFCPVECRIKDRAPIYMLRPHALVHIIVALETGIRNQHIQWLSYDFDKEVLREDLVNEDVYQLFVKTDKSNKSWTALTSGRVIKILREMRIFRDLIGCEKFDEKLYYEGRVDNAVYSPFKVLFAFNTTTGNPYSDHVYEHAFINLLMGVQHAADHYGMEVSLFKYEATDNEPKAKITSDISPHSCRVTVVSEYCQYLNSEYVGRYITNQKVATVWYYTKYDAEHLRKMQEEQKAGLAKYSREKAEVNLMGAGGTTIDATDPNSSLVKGFSADPQQAILDFGAVSTNFFDRETGISIITSNRKLNLAFEPTHICPFGRICPKDRHKIGYQHRCNFCDYAIRTVDHLTGIASRIRDLIEEMEYLESYLDHNEKKLTEGEVGDVEKRLSVLGEDIGSLDLSRKILEENYERLKNGEKGSIVHVYQPEMVVKNLEAMPFPDPEDEKRYLLARLGEVVAYPSETQTLIRMKLLELKNNILANTGNIRAALKGSADICRIEADVYAMVNSLRSVYGLSLDQVAEIASRDIDEMLKLGGQERLQISGISDYGDFLVDTGTDG
jgi:hypothetical protein